MSDGSIRIEWQGPEPSGPLSEALSRRLLGASAGSEEVLALDGKAAGAEEVAALLPRARPLLVLAPRPEHMKALGLGISTGGSSEAFLYMPGAEPRIVEFHQAADAPLLFSSAEEGEVRAVRPGEVPPPEDEDPGVPDPADAFEDAPHPVAGAIVNALRAAPDLPPLPVPPKGVLFYKFPSLQKILTVSLPDACYENKYAPSQVGELSVLYRFTGFADRDTTGRVASLRLRMDISAAGSPALGGDLVTVVENRKYNFPPDKWLGWFQSRLFVGLDHDINRPMHRLGTTPHTLNRMTKETTTKGFTFDVGFEVGSDGEPGPPKTGLNYAHSMSTETTFGDWLVGELSDSRRTAWEYAVAHPYDGRVDGDLNFKVPETSEFTTQSLSGIDFLAGAAWEIPLTSRGQRPDRLDLRISAGWRLTYFYRRRAGVTRYSFDRDASLPGDNLFTLDLNQIPGAR